MGMKEIGPVGGTYAYVFVGDLTDFTCSSGFGPGTKETGPVGGIYP